MATTLKFEFAGLISNHDGFRDGFEISSSSRYDRKYEEVHTINLNHKILNVSQNFSGKDLSILKNKIQNVINKWVVLWNKMYTDTSLSAKIKNQKEELSNLLNATLEIYDAVNWDILKNNYEFGDTSLYKELVAEIENLTEPERPELHVIPDKPFYEDPKINFWNSIVPGKKLSIVNNANLLFNKAILNWENEVSLIEIENKKIITSYEERVKEFHFEKNKLELKLNDAELEFQKEKKLTNEKVELLKTKYHEFDVDSIEEYCEIVLRESVYPDYFPRSFELEYHKESKVLLVEFMLPSPNNIPRAKDVKFINSKNEVSEILYTDTEFNKLYDIVIYQILIRTVHELFEADIIDAIVAVNLNGWVEYLDKATGKYSTKCITSLNVKKEEFLNINLELVDAAACFKNLKGVSATRLNTLTPIPPIATINKEDKRFISSKDVLYQVEQGTNLAEMPWEDFEHLIRELFEKEFSFNGGEVRVTQASKDGGVDAVAFDPDPIRGGKIVIQAKRYTNTVGVSAIRDLYGTVLNEGATKGIIVTTSTFGPDAYEFSKNKPLTLLTGSNLLSLLEKHGQRARIDLLEAKAKNKE